MVVGKWESMRGGFGRDSILWTGSGFALILNLMQDRFNNYSLLGISTKHGK